MDEWVKYLPGLDPWVQDRKNKRSQMQRAVLHRLIGNSLSLASRIMNYGFEFQFIFSYAVQHVWFYLKSTLEKAVMILL